MGSCNVDLVVRCAHLPAPGETILGGDVARLPGGKGANQAAALAALGARVSLFAAVGDDANGDWLVENLAARGVDVAGVQRSARPTGTALITVDDAGENTIVVSSGANADLDLADVDLGDFDVVLAQLEVTDAVVETVVERAARLVLNAAPARALPAGLVERCAVVIANEVEASMLDLAQIGHCVVSLGAAGAARYDHGTETFRLRPPAVTPVDTVGAGDVFCAAYASRVALGEGEREALAFAVTAGALATLAPGAQGSLPTTEEVTSWIARVS